MKNSLNTVGIVGIFVFATMLAFTSCAEDVKTSNMSVKMVNYGQQQKDLTTLNAIYLDVIRCEVHYSSPAAYEGWHTLPTNPGIYNLLDVDTDATVILVHDTLMPHGDVEQYRLILGNNNTIDLGGTIYPLTVPSAQQSGLKINIDNHINFTHGIEIVLAFDPYHSIVEQGNGGYTLKPVIKVDVINQF